MTRTPTEPLRCTCGCEDFRLVDEGFEPGHHCPMWECRECDTVWADAAEAAQAVAEQEEKEAEKIAGGGA